MKPFQFRLVRIALYLRLRPIAFAVLLSALVTPSRAALFFSDSGFNPSDIQETVDNFRSALGTLNPNVVGSFETGRREINWDGVPDAFAAPNNLPANFFNVNSPRGVVFSTPGTGFQVSATAASGTPVEFGNINPSYPGLFQTFSPQRMFTSLGSNIVDVNFFVPGTTTPAFTTGFGAVFSDVNVSHGTSIAFFGPANEGLVSVNPPGTCLLPVPNCLGSNLDETLTFVGVVFDAGEQVSRVRITSGTSALGPDQRVENSPPLVELVVMDDFIFGEPRAIAAVPEPEAYAMILAGLCLLGFAVHRSRQTAA